MAEIMTPVFWTGLLAIIGVNIVLSGDNAVVIALAARSLPPKQQKLAIAWGSGAAVVMRIVLTIIAVEMLRWPYLKLIGAVLLLWIAIQLLQPEDESHEDGTAVNTGLGAAIRTILIADLVMSLDNVLAVAAAAKGSIVLLVAGLAISIPLVVFGSTLLLKLMERFPIIITLGAALLGWVAGDMAATDPAIKDWVAANVPWLHSVAEVIGAVFVVVVGMWLAKRERARRAAAPARVTAGAAAADSPAPPPAAGAVAPTQQRFERFLLPVDASDSAERAVQYVLALMKIHAGMDVHVINVQRGVSGEASRFATRESLDDYHREQSDTALKRARALLDAAGAKYSTHTFVGDPAETIVEQAKSMKCDHIIMGTRGLGSYTGALVGSVAQSVAALSTVPVVLVK
jgi:YjbE family integral membrane protein